jgi:hypothetical protein
MAMAENSLETYLNDHLAGATFGSDLAEQIRDRAQGTPLGAVMQSIAREVEEDRQTLLDLMERTGSSKNRAKQATTWLSEKASRAKFGGLAGTESGLAVFMSIETLSLGVEGKLSLWTALRGVAEQYSALDPVELDGLIERAQGQRRLLERERIGAARQALQANRQVPADDESLDHPELSSGPFTRT